MSTSSSFATASAVTPVTIVENAATPTTTASPAAKHGLKVATYNVDQLNDAKWEFITKKFLLCAEPVHLLFLTETKRQPPELTNWFKQVKTNYDWIINSHNPTRYHGVSLLYSKSLSVENIENIIKEQIQDCPVRSDCNDKKGSAAIGRIVGVSVNQSFFLVGMYVPNAGHQEPAKLEYRTKRWDPAVYKLLNHLKTMKPVLWLGDLNIAPSEEDVTHPSEMKQYGGFTKEERENFSTFLSTPISTVTSTSTTTDMKSSDGKSPHSKKQWVDVFRHMYPNAVQYTWRGRIPKQNNKTKNNMIRRQMRLDHMIASHDLVPHVRFIEIDSEPELSDHCPLVLQIDL